MIYLSAVILGILFGLLLKGRLSNLAAFKIQKSWLLLTAFAIQSSSQILALKGIGFTRRYSLIINLLVFCMLFIVLWLNRKYFGMAFVGVGCFLNAAVMTLNGGKMPVSKELLLKEQLYSIIDIYQVGGDGKHILAGEATRLAFLGDMISIPGKFGYIAKFVSIGDLFVVMGIFALILQILLENESKDKSEGNLAGHK